MAQPGGYDPANQACVEVPGSPRRACIDKAAPTRHNRALIKSNPIL
jgi:hypothetical protein